MLPRKIYGGGEKTILSVEDDDAAFLILEIGFDEVGGNFALFRACDGEQALKLLKRDGTYVDAPRPDLVLLNLNLPRVNGFEVLSAIKDDPNLRDIPVIIFSSSRLDHDKARCLALGARSFVTKPSDVDQLILVLRDVCSLV